MTTVGGILTSVTRQLDDDGVEGRAAVDAPTRAASTSCTNGPTAPGGSAATSSAARLPAARTPSDRRSARRAATIQRPDSDALELDPTATSMRGYAGTIQLRKPSGLHWTGDVWVGVISPGFEINDIGFLQRSDRLATGGALRYNERRPGRMFRTWGVGIVQNHTQELRRRLDREDPPAERIGDLRQLLGRRASTATTSASASTTGSRAAARMP